MDHPIPGIQPRSALIASGLTDRELGAARRRGTLCRPVRGAYAAGGLPAEPAARHALAVRAVLPRVAGCCVASHASAAVLHGLPLWRVPLDRVHVTRTRAGGGRRRAGLHVHVAPLDPGDVVAVDGLPVTAPARTVVDLARTCRFEEAVVTADAALRSGLVTPTDLEAALDRATGWPGAPAARRAVAFADGRGESVGESRSRVAIARAGLPAPHLQFEVRDHHGVLIARTDFGWPAHRAVGEFDGRVKYGRLLRPGQDAADAVYAEKLREDAVRATDLGMVRWGWADLTDFAPVAGRLRRAFR